MSVQHTHKSRCVASSFFLLRRDEREAPPPFSRVHRHHSVVVDGERCLLFAVEYTFTCRRRGGLGGEGTGDERPLPFPFLPSPPLPFPPPAEPTLPLPYLPWISLLVRPSRSRTHDSGSPALWHCSSSSALSRHRVQGALRSPFYLAYRACGELVSGDQCWCASFAPLQCGPARPRLRLPER